MVNVYDKAECSAYGAMMFAKGLRLDDSAVKAALVKTASGSYYVSSKQGKAFKASLVIAGYWAAVNDSSNEAEGLDF